MGTATFEFATLSFAVEVEMRCSLSDDVSCDLGGDGGDVFADVSTITVGTTCSGNRATNSVRCATSAFISSPCGVGVGVGAGTFEGWKGWSCGSGLTLIGASKGVTFFCFATAASTSLCCVASNMDEVDSSV